ncbi:hypothetical protein IH785_18235 [candidate division KSB1 bacterium]|nr:hypothetical protein [candidate division KSB1 bacterium]
MLIPGAHSDKIFLFGILLLLEFPLMAQDSNFRFSMPEIERILKSGDWQVSEVSTISRLGSEASYQAKRATLELSAGKTLRIKWKTAPRAGEDFNNQPRYEIAAYELQKLFLTPEYYVVPPTLGLTLPVQQYRQIDRDVLPTFDDTQSVIFVAQYWLDQVTPEHVFDRARFDSDTTYARHLANMNILSYLIKHRDSNVGNFLISTDPKNPRVFAVDNGVAFESEASARGTAWQRLRVKRLPKETIERLRNITPEDLEKSLGVVLQFTGVDGFLIQISPTPNLDKKQGVRRNEGLIQFGLTESEIKGVYKRLQKLIEEVDAGKIQLF